jgi:hypothetical protein
MQMNAATGTLPFVSWLSTDEDGHFSSNETYAGAGTVIRVQFISNINNQDVYSNTINFVIPNPGNVYSFGTVTVRPGGIIKGRLKDNANNYLSGGYLYFNQEGGSGASEVYFNSPIDSLGYFSLSGPPNITLTNMRGGAQSGSGSYGTEPRTLSFPASGAISDIGTIIMTPITKR